MLSLCNPDNKQADITSSAESITLFLTLLRRSLGLRLIHALQEQRNAFAFLWVARAHSGQDASYFPRRLGQPTFKALVSVQIGREACETRPLQTDQSHGRRERNPQPGCVECSRSRNKTLCSPGVSISLISHNSE